MPYNSEYYRKRKDNYTKSRQKYDDKNREQRLAYYRDYVKTHKEQVYGQIKEWKKANKDYVAAYNHDYWERNKAKIANKRKGKITNESNLE